MSDELKEKAKCRWCGRELRGDAYMYGGLAFDPATNEMAKVNYYGGFVCSAHCDFQVSLDLERSMPGHGYGQTRLGDFAQKSYINNWRPK